MSFNRRTVLTAVAGGFAMSATASTVAGDDDTKGDAPPNENVPDADVYAWPEKDDPLQVENGNWITFSGGWITTEDISDECELRWFLNNSTHTFTIDDETFVLDSFDDWEFDDDVEETWEHSDDEVLEIHCRATFSHTIQPKSPGETFTVRREGVVDNWEPFEEDPFAIYPVENEVEVVSRGNR